MAWWFAYEMAFVTARHSDGMKRMCARRMLGAILLIGLTSLASSAASSQFARFLNGATFVAKPPVPKGINAFCFRTSSGSAIIVVWRIKPDGRGDVGSIVAKVPLTIPDRAVAYDMFGNRLPEGALLVGEDPVYIMQKSTEEKTDEDY